jgi:uncharacterized protein (TIGR03118 family)
MTGVVATVPPLASPLQRLPGVDLLRALSILLVVLHHVGLRVPLAHSPWLDRWPASVVDTLSARGYEAVYVFFAVSGFLIASHTLQRWGSLAAIDVRAFYRRRAARILPCLLLIAVLARLALLRVGRANHRGTIGVNSAPGAFWFNHGPPTFGAGHAGPRGLHCVVHQENAMKPAWSVGFAILFALQPVDAQTNSYTVTSIIDSTQDPYLFNPWGLSRPSSASVKESEWWAADNLTGVSTLYYANQMGPASLAPLVVTVPPAAGHSVGSPTGTAYNAATGPGPGTRNFAFATLDGTISNWNAGAKPSVPGNSCFQCHVGSATIEVDHSALGASYQGLTIAKNPATGKPTYYVANSNGGVEAYDAATFAAASLPAGAFTDPNVPATYSPAGIQSIGSAIYVLYNAVGGGGRGYVDGYDAGGALKRRLQQGSFNQPWGIAKAPANFGLLSNLLLVGNTGSGKIGAYSPTTGRFVDFMRDAGGQPIVIPGLWALSFGIGTADSGPTNVLYFTAGGPDLTTGMFGAIAAN